KGTVFMLMLCGLSFLIACRFFPLHSMGHILKQTIGKCFRPKTIKDTISPFDAMATALGGTMGVGNIIGVASAIAIGGAGSIFWLWIAGICGMMIKYGEVFLAIKYRVRKDDSWCGGPMYYISRGLGIKSLAVLFAICCVLASFGMGNMAQTNAAAGCLNKLCNLSPLTIALILGITVAIIICGGMGRIVKVCSKLVPLMSLIYLLGAAWILFCNYTAILPAFSSIFTGAFGFNAIGGASFGLMWQAMQVGISKGIFTNEAGLGSASIAHACSDESDPHIQGMWGIFEVFADTIVVCTITALVILTSDINCNSIVASQVTAAAFYEALGTPGGIIVNISVVFFALASVLGWCLYGEKAIDFLFKNSKAISYYRICFIFLAVIGAIIKLETVWLISDIINGIMLFPNMLALLMLCPEFICPLIERHNDD
ncbi:MAG: alanine/glycine:cation symporter family protein, partial [Oscillospiraceae bacterium]